MANSVYKIIQLVGTSDSSFDEAAKNAVETASASLDDVRIAEVERFDIRIENGKVVEYRAKVNVSFKVHKKVD